MTSEQYDAIRAAFDRGKKKARDHQNADVADDPNLPRITTVYSDWLLQYCRYCEHSFRIGDKVRLDPTYPGRMLHEDAATGLYCWSRDRGESVSPSLLNSEVYTDARKQFLDGLHRGLQSEQHTDRQHHIEEVPPRSPLIRRRCPICGHTVRVGDSIVRSPDFDRSGGVFHEDVDRQLRCWSKWNVSGVGRIRDYSAFTGARLSRDEYQKLLTMLGKHDE